MWTVENFLLMTWQLLPRKKIYKDTINDITYICDAQHGAILTDNVWKVQKLILDGDWDVEETFETDWYNNPATDLSVVQALDFK